MILLASWVGWLTLLERDNTKAVASMARVFLFSKYAPLWLRQRESNCIIFFVYKESLLLGVFGYHKKWAGVFCLVITAREGCIIRYMGYMMILITE